MQSWAPRDHQRDVAGHQTGGCLSAQAVTHGDGVVLAAGQGVDARLQLAAQISRVVVQPAAEQLDVDNMGRPRRAQIQRPGQDFAGETEETHQNTCLHFQISTNAMPISATAAPAISLGCGIWPKNSTPRITPPVTSWVAIRLTIVACVRRSAAL